MPQNAKPPTPETAPPPATLDLAGPQQNEQLFEALIHNAADVVQLVGTDTLIKYVNPAVRGVLGYAPEELIGHAVPEQLHPDELVLLEKSFFELAQQPGGKVHIEQRVRHKDGNYRWVEVTATNLLHDPAVQAIMVNYHDITERRQTEEALRQERFLMRALMNNIPDAIYFKDAESRFIRVNQALIHKHGLTEPEEILGKTDFDFFTKESAQTYFDEEQSIIRTGKVFIDQEEEEDWPDKPTTWASTTKLPLRDDDGQIVGTIGVTRDITQHKVAEAALRRSQGNLAAAQAIAHLGSWELDLSNLNNLNANALRWSDEVYRIFGYQPGEIEATNENFFNAVPPDERPAIQAAVQQAISEGRQYSMDHRIVLPDGTERIVHEQSDIVYDGQTGQPLMMAGIVQDITERRQVEAALAAKTDEIREMTQQLWETAKLATMGELAASIAHELNNPLATIHLRVEALLADLPAESPQRRPLEIVSQESERMARLVANLLQSSRRSTRQISTIDVCAEIQNTLELLHYHLQHQQITVVDECQPNLLPIPFDRQQLRQVLLNLFTNASDAMPEGGTLTVRAYQTPGWLKIEVADTGTGIAPEKLPYVMEPFFTTKPEGKGTGLGLAICKRIMQEHGGAIEIMSEGLAGRGTLARLTLPIQPDTMNSVTL